MQQLRVLGRHDRSCGDGFDKGPDILLCEKYQESLIRKTPIEPEKDLMFAVLEDAICCFGKTLRARTRQGKSLFRETEDWILERGTEGIFSFENICEILGLSPQYIRQGLIRWKEAETAWKPKAKVYRLTPGTKQKKRPVGGSEVTGQNALKAAGR